jgi:hypothetical protein
MLRTHDGFTKRFDMTDAHTHTHTRARGVYVVQRQHPNLEGATCPCKPFGLPTLLPMDDKSVPKRHRCLRCQLRVRQRYRQRPHLYPFLAFPPTYLPPAST